MKEDYLEDKCVTVIIPTYNRGYLIEKTIPTYFQENVKNIIVVDDASTDNTQEILKKLNDKNKNILFIRNKNNKGQTYSKNVAIKHIKTPFVYFGDDDSFILPKTIKYLLKTMIEMEADIVAALAVYMDSENDFRDINKFIKKKAPLKEDLTNIVDFNHLEKVNFCFRANRPIQLPFTQACILIKKEYLEKVKFDETFAGNAYREETDFLLSCNEIGAKIYFDSRGVQVNYPFSMLNRHRTFKSMFRHGYYDLLNTVKLINKHHWYFRKKYNYKHSKLYMIIIYIINSFFLYLKILPNRIYEIMRRKLIN